jgi:hypothetical protein
METTTMEIVEFPLRQIVATGCRWVKTNETKHITGVFYNVTVATDCRTRVIESWQMVSRIRSAEHLHKPRATELQNDSVWSSSIYKRQIHPLVREGAPQKEDCNSRGTINIGSWTPGGCSIPRLTDWLIVSRNMTLTLTWLRNNRVSRNLDAIWCNWSQALA